VPILAEVVDGVVGIDTHRDTHEAELSTAGGVALAKLRISNSGAGYAQLLQWITEHSPGPRIVIAIEGSRSYGVGLARAIAAAGYPIVECEQPARKTRRGRGKSDVIDAHLAVLFALRQDADQMPTPRADGIREALRIVLGARHELTVTTTAQTNRLRALLLSGDDVDRDISRATLTETRLSALARRRLPVDSTRAHAIRHREIRRLAVALRANARELKANRTQLQELVEEMAPGFLQRPGVGPVSAAQVIVSYSHPGRVRSDAAFAALAGTSPLEASSGQRTRHRLNRGGDRALNRAIHTIALTRMRSCARTRDYIARRTTEGKTSREIRRSLKRYITRELYRTLNTIMTLDNT
jgi:transposase